MLLGCGLLKPQSGTNLEIMALMLDSVYTEAQNAGIVTPQSNVSLNLTGDLRYFESRLSKRKNMELEQTKTVLFTLESARVSYTNPERSGWFGGLLYTRIVEVRGHWFTDGNGRREFLWKYTDSIPEDSIGSVEQSYLPVSVGIKEEPGLITGYAIEITAAVVTAVAAYLFYSVRSK